MTNFTNQEVLTNQLSKCDCSDAQECKSCFKLLNLIQKENIEKKILSLKNELIDLKNLRDITYHSNLINDDILSLLHRLKNEQNKNNEFIEILQKYQIEYDKRNSFDATKKEIEQKYNEKHLLIDERSRIIQKIKAIK